MKSYSIARMRRECQTLFRRLLTQAVLNLVTAAVFGAMYRVLDIENTKAALIMTGVFVALSILLLGIYLVLSDSKWLLKHTEYGRRLERLGNAQTVMEEIDREALRMEYEGAQFALMEHWLVLYQWSARAVGSPGTVKSYPIPKQQVKRIAWARDTDQENGRYLVRVETEDGMYEIIAWEQADIQALSQWGALQETRDV